MEQKLIIITADAPWQEEYVLGAGQSLDLLLAVFPGADLSRSLHVVLDGEGARVRLSGLYLCDGAQRFSLSVLLEHRSPRCHSEQLFRGLAAGESRARFAGRIIVAPGAAGTEAAQENHNLLLSPSARVESEPQLEIYADDVQCSHGATSGNLDAEALFYMQSRGVPQEEARYLQMLSFLAPVLNRAEGGALRERLLAQVEAQLRGMNARKSGSL